VVCSLSPGGPLEAALRARGVRVHSLGFGRVGRERRGYAALLIGGLAALWRLWRFIRHERPAIVHGVLFWAYVMGTFAARLAGVPVIIASRRSLGLFKAEKPHYLFVERLADRMTDLFIANSEAVRGDTLQRERLEGSRVIVIHNGVDLSRFDGRVDGRLVSSLQLSSSPRAIVVSNFIHYKGHEFFLRAWAQVLRKFPSAIALLVGDGVLRGELETLADSLGIRHSLRFLGVRHDVPSLLALADVYVHPSLQEGYSNAVLEAMAAARPVVVTAVGGNVEAVADGRTGLLVPARDVAAVSAALMRVFANPQLAHELGDAARRAVRERFDVDAMVRQYERVFAGLIAERLAPQHRAGAADAC
jgi:glycosyltransferase involved in cell wall biosynthesis